jgi:transcriptional regulator with XRE-family HTH domain
MDHDLYSAPQVKLRELLKRARVRKGLTQTQVSIMLGQYKSFANKYESGQRMLNSTEWIEILLQLEADPSEVAIIISEMLTKEKS